MIKLLVLDVDGTMTDGSISYDSNKVESKTFNVKDGFAIVNSKSVGYKTAIITGRKSKIVQNRAEELGIDYCFQGVKNKLNKLYEILELEGITMRNVASIGDDINDYMMLKKSKISFAPSDCNTLILDVVDVHLDTRGGSGAVAKMIEYLLKKENKLEKYLKSWIKH